MKLKSLMLISTVAAVLAGCDGGDINLAPTTVDNSNQGNTSNPAPATEENPCAKYEEAGQTFQGAYSGGNCTYSATFVSDTKPITVSALTIPKIDGVHIFENSLYVGEDVDRNAAATGKRIPQEGEGTKLTIAAGNVLVFKAANSYVRIARGSQIYANGTAAAPITFTADEDAAAGGAGATENDRGLWGGLQINGNGRTNKCHDGTTSGSGTGTVSDFAATSNNVHNCHVTAEGRPATYGGNNNAESSGSLQYLVIKHAGFEVVDGNELNALTLNAVGSGTTISHVETYTTQDDGIELFGGAVNMDHVVLVNVGDDSIDYSEGYNGKIQYAVVLQTSGSNRCIEGDNTGEGRGDGITPTTNLVISNMSCITSNVDMNAGTNPSSKGDAEGPLFREGVFFQVYNSLITSNATAMASNECIELDDTEGPQTIDAAQAGTSIAKGNLIACSEPVKVTDNAKGNLGFDLANWLAGGGINAQTPAVAANVGNVVLSSNLPANLIVGGVGTRGVLTTVNLTNSAGTVIYTQALSTAPAPGNLFDVATLDGFFDTPVYVGGANELDNWVSGWTVGLTGNL